MRQAFYKASDGRHALAEQVQRLGNPALRAAFSKYAAALDEFHRTLELKYLWD